MNVKSWTVCLVEPNKFEGQIILDLLRNAGVDRVKMYQDHETAIDNLELYPANIVIAAFELGDIDGATWTRAFRRNHKLANRKAAIFLTSGAFSRSMAEDCRHAGANALIGKPISGKVLLATINKVLTHPRPFIDAEGYVGPCRRAGIVTAGTTSKRRKADDSANAPAGQTLEQAVTKLAEAAGVFAKDFAKRDVCEAALRAVQGYAVNAGDGPLMRACAAFALQLSGSAGLRADAVRTAVEECVAGVAELVATPSAEAQKREAIAERVRQAVGKAAMQRAA